jgi:hypothetical protein
MREPTYLSHAVFAGTIAALLAIALAPHPASAQRRGREHGLFFVTATAGFGDCDDEFCDNDGADTSPLPGFGGGFYIRPIPYFAAGVDLHLNFMDADHRDDRHDDELARDWLANAAVRGIIPIGRVEPWMGASFGFAGWGYAWTDRDRNRDRDETLTGPNFAFGGGVDIRITDQFALGGMTRFAFPFWTEYCTERDDPDRHDVDCRDFDDLDPDEEDAATDMLWYVGMTGRFEFSP